MEKTKLNSKFKLALGIILIILGATLVALSAFRFWYYFWIDATFYLFLSILFMSVGGVLIANYSAEKKEADKNKMEQMIEEKYGVQVSILASKPQIVNCNNCNAEIECYENQQIIRCPQCGKTYKNPYYKEK